MNLWIWFVFPVLASGQCDLETWSSNCVRTTDDSFCGRYVLSCQCDGGALTSSFFVGVPQNVTKIVFPVERPTSIVDFGTWFPNLQCIFTGSRGHRNRIVSLSPGAFANLPALQTLDLLGNDIDSTSLEAFANLPSLQTLNLDSNRIDSLPPGAFANLPALQILNLQSTGISSTSPGVFANLPSLQTLNLQGNQIDSLSSGAFDNLPALQTLDLQSNRIYSLSPGAFTNLPALQTLNLDSNRIDSLSPGVFTNLPSLQNLNLQSNLIYSLSLEAFANLSALQTLNLQSNQIDSLPPGVFANLPGLQILNLQSNQFAFVPQFINTPSLHTILLSPNSNLHYLDSSLLERCNCGVPLLHVPYFTCPEGSSVDNRVRFYGCSCQPGYVCSPLGPVACEPGSYSQGLYVDSISSNDTVCEPCPRGTFNDQEAQAQCSLCPAGTMATSNGCMPCAIPATCLPGTSTPLSIAQVSELANPSTAAVIRLENSAHQGKQFGSIIGVIVVFTILAVLAFLLPWMSKKLNLPISTARYFDLMSLSHRVALGKSLVRDATWLGVAVSVAFLCGAVMIVAVLINSNTALTEYWLTFRQVFQNEHNQLTLTLTPWTNDAIVCSQSMFYDQKSLIEDTDYEFLRGNCTLSVLWNMASDTRLQFSFPPSVQAVKWTVEYDDLFGTRAQQAAFITPLSSEFVFSQTEVSIEFSVRDAFFLHEQESRTTQGLQVLFDQIDRGVPNLRNATQVTQNQWSLEVSFQMLDTALNGRTYLPQTATQLFAAIVSIIVSLLAISRAIFAHGIEPVFLHCNKAKPVQRFQDIETQSVVPDEMIVLKNTIGDLQSTIGDLQNTISGLKMELQNTMMENKNAISEINKRLNSGVV